MVILEINLLTFIPNLHITLTAHRLLEQVRFYCM